MYIPFASLLGLQALLEPLLHKQPAPEVAFIDGVDFVDPRPGGGSLLDHDSGGLGEPLNVSFFGFPFSSLPSSADLNVASPPQRAFLLRNKKNVDYYLGEELSVGPRRRRLCALCKRNRIVGFWRAYTPIYDVSR